MSTISETAITEILAQLLGRDVTGGTAQVVDPHEVSVRGLVTNEDHLVAVIASDLDFAHRSGAALAMIPVGTVEEKGDNPDSDLLEFYSEVANVLSRLVDEALPMRVRLDPAMTHPPEALKDIMANGSVVAACETTIAGYGTGNVGVWYKAPAA